MATRPSSISRVQACELKGAGFTFTVLRLFDADPERIARQVTRRIEQAPDFFKGAPIVLDLQAVPEGDWDLSALVERLRALDLVPVAVRGADSVHEQQARTLALGVLAESRSTGEPRPAVVETTPTTRLVTEPVRSGQQIYAKGDLIVVGPVSHGAELLAEGNIHVYGALRGRALAGLRGERSARIFCRALEAELISVAGYYRLAEDVEPTLRGQGVQIYLEGENLHVLPL
ncbi:MAG TPA: septum site-determining protein MinC [Candidatus Macondimonas sp.]|nr:septum site-determining protein MinC [Candidatus Macondimonas sp.]